LNRGKKGKEEEEGKGEKEVPDVFSSKKGNRFCSRKGGEGNCRFSLEVIPFKKRMGREKECRPSFNESLPHLDCREKRNVPSRLRRSKREEEAFSFFGIGGGGGKRLCPRGVSGKKKGIDSLHIREKSLGEGKGVKRREHLFLRRGKRIDSEKRWQGRVCRQKKE